MMKAYVAIGHFKDSKNTTSVAMTQVTKKAFMIDCYGNEFVPYVVLTENMIEKLHAAESADKVFGIYEQVKKLTTNYRIWNEVTDYIQRCFDIIEEKVKTVRE